jgi:glycosyltransferase involved in cell wall biosynthesis
MSDKPLVSIGVPTYNRPAGLRKALTAITRQSYRNIEVIVSDNGSPGEEVKQVVKEFSNGDPRVIFYSHDVNQGPTFNFRFVLEKANADYFMWAADDDEWLEDNFLELLMEHAPNHVLTFPDAVLTSANGGQEYPLRVYEGCITRLDYVKAFCSTGQGYPFYGLFNLILFKEMGHRFEFDADLAYYNEGTFIHKLFVRSPVKYVKQARMCFSTDSPKPANATMINSFVEYFKRTVLIYALSDLSAEEKKEVMDVIFGNYTMHLNNLVINHREGKIETRASGIRRIKRALRILVSGNN